MLSRVNLAVAHAEDEQSLLADACRIAVESGYFGYARAKCAVAGANGPTLVEYPSSGGTVRIGPTEALDDPVPWQCRAATRGVARPHRCRCAGTLRTQRADPWAALSRQRATAARRCDRGISVPVRARTQFLRAGRTCHARRGLAQPVVRTRFARPAARARAGRAQHEAYLRLRAIVDASTSAIWLTDIEGRCLLANQRCAEWFQAPLEQLLGRTREELFSREDAAQIAARDRQVLETGQAISLEEKISIGGERTVLVNLFPYGTSGHIYAVGGISTDVTESRQAADQIRALNDRWGSLIAASPAAIFDLDADGRVWTVWNHAAEELSGVPARDAIGHPPPMMHPSAQTAERLRQRALAGEIRGVEVTRRRLDGSVAHVNVSFAPLRNGDDKVDGGNSAC